MVHFEDKKLAKKIINGDEKKFNDFFDYYFPRLYRFSLRRLDGNEDLTKDIVQETLFIAIKNMKQYRGEASLMSWLCQINRSQISRYFKKNKIKQIVRIDDSQEISEIFDNIHLEISQTPEFQYQQSKLQEIIVATLDNLPHGYGDLLEWKYVDHMSVKTIAENLNLSTTAVQSKLSRARDAFKIVLTKILGENHNQLYFTEES